MADLKHTQNVINETLETDLNLRETTIGDIAQQAAQHARDHVQSVLLSPTVIDPSMLGEIAEWNSQHGNRVAYLVGIATQRIVEHELSRGLTTETQDQ